MSPDEGTSIAAKRRKTVGGLRLSKASPADTIAEGSDSDSSICGPLKSPRLDNGRGGLTRQCHINTRFPQRRNPAKDCAVPAAQPTSADKLISGIWRQLHSPINLALPSPVSIDGESDLGMSVTDCVLVSGTRN